MLKISFQDDYCHKPLEEEHGSDGFCTTKPGLVSRSSQVFRADPNTDKEHDNVNIIESRKKDSVTSRIGAVLEGCRMTRNIMNNKRQRKLDEMWPTVSGSNIKAIINHNCQTNLLIEKSEGGDIHNVPFTYNVP